MIRYPVCMERHRLPAIDRLLRGSPQLPRALALKAARALVAEVRAGGAAPEDWQAALEARVGALQQPRLKRVINATGVVLHTNLGRAPMSAAVAARVAEAAQGYCNLELDLASGDRGERLGPVRQLLAALAGAEDAVAVNNNAAATLLMLTALAAGKEVVVSRGELVEIGGSFRIPEVIAAGGARLREVGATNRTRLEDYVGATNSETAAWLLVHPSNFRMEGFVGRPSRESLVAAAHARGILVLEDLGSGALLGSLGEPTVSEVVGAGVDMVCFSGDKLLGGPQAGLAVGRAALVQRLRKHPLYRALRLDRLVLSALEATLMLYEQGELPPVLQMLAMDAATLKRRSLAFAAQFKARGGDCYVEADQGLTGGGARPEVALAGYVVCVRGPAEALAAALRRGPIPVVARVAQGVVRLDLRTVLVEEEPLLLEALCGGADCSLE